MAKTPSTSLIKLAQLSGLSRKTVQAKFAQPGAPLRTRPVEELVTWLRRSTKSKPVEVPADYEDQMLVAKLEREKWGAVREKEAAEKIRLWNLEKRGRMVERSSVISQGAAVGEVISSEISRIAKELPTAVAGMDPSRIRQKVEDAMDHLIDCIDKALEQLEADAVEPGEEGADDE